MIETETRPLNSLPTANEFADASRRRTRKYVLFAAMVTLAIAIPYAHNETLFTSVNLLTAILAIGVFWHYPRFSLYLVFAGVCLFEQLPTKYKDALTDQVPFFWNYNTIVQRFVHEDFKAIPLNLMELLLLIAGSCALVRAVFTHEHKLRVGNLFWPIFIYICFVMWGWINGMATGGDYKISLMEVRPQLYLLLAYLVAVNVLRERRQVDTLLWIMVVCIGIKGILYTFRQYVTLAGLPVPDQGVGSHEEAFFFDAYLMLLIVLTLFREHKRLKWLMWFLVPFVVTGNLATNRRAGTAALAIALPILFMAADRAMPKFRTRIRVIGISLAVLLTLYYYAFKNSESSFAQPARAISSTFQPSARDASSNAYRDAENADLMATIKLDPIRGYGYGKHMMHAVPIADISTAYELWDVMTHNSVLWVWMRVGTFGFVAFWMMISAVVVRACTTLRDPRSDSYVKALLTYSILVVSMLMIVGLLDLQISAFRDMLFTGFWVGALTALPLMPADTSTRTEAGQ